MPWAVPHLKHRSEFVRIARRGRSWAAPGLVLQMLRREPPADPAARPMPPLRVGFTVSRKVGNAVARNRARRRLRAAAERVLPAAAAADADYVLIGRSATLTRPFPALLDDLSRALRKVGAEREERPPSAGPAGAAR